MPLFLLNPVFLPGRIYSNAFFWFLAVLKLQHLKVSPAPPLHLLSRARLEECTIILLPSTPSLKDTFSRYCSGFGASEPSHWFCWAKEKNWRLEIFLTCPNMRPVTHLAETLACMPAHWRAWWLWQYRVELAMSQEGLTWCYLSGNVNRLAGMKLWPEPAHKQGLVDFYPP